MATSFSTAAEDVISREIHTQLDTTAVNLSPDKFVDFYELDRTATEIQNGDYKRIALQFPDELLHDAVPIFRALKAKIDPNRELYVLADTSYGSCCVDEVAAQHVDADAMVHYGYACMSNTSRLPVIYVFGKKPIDVQDCVSGFLQIFHDSAASTDSTRRQHIVLRHSVEFTHQSENILRALRKAVEIPITYTQILTGPSESSTTTSPSPNNDCTIFYIGAESLGLTNLLMTHSSCDIYSYDPATKLSRLESIRTNRLLMRRYAILQKARDADVFGILVGTLGVASYLPLISHLRALLAHSHKKSYTITVGKLNPAKLANFQEIECWVLVACPENSLVEAKDFLRPIVTPYELEVALQAEQSWTGRYVLDFERLLSDHHAATPPEGHATQENHEDLDQPVFSLITGKYRHPKRYGAPSATKDVQPTIEDGVASSTAIALRNQDGSLVKLVDSAASEFLQMRTYQGLDMRFGQDEPSVMEQGRSGIAKGYQDDHV